MFFINKQAQAISVLTLNTIAFTACFAVWVIFSIIGIPIKDLLALSETQFGLLVATPILTGSIFRLPIGMLTDKLGGRIVYFVLMLTIVIPLWFVSEATEYWQFLILGLFIGVAGSSFSVGIAYTAKWFDKNHQGFAMGIFGALGGWFSDKYGAYKVIWWVMWISLICLFFMSYPQTIFIIKTVSGEQTLDIGLNVWVFTALLFVLGIAWGFGKASVFKFLSNEYPSNIGVVSGVVGLACGMGGFLLPIMFGSLVDFTGINSTIFMLLYGATAVSLIWMYFTFAKKF